MRGSLLQILFVVLCAGWAAASLQAQPVPVPVRVKTELQAMATPLAAIPPYLSSTCIVPEGASLEALLDLITKAAQAGHWDCCAKLMAVAEAKRNGLLQAQRLRIKLAQATILTARQRYAQAMLQAADINREATASNHLPEKAQALLLLSYSGLYTRDLAGGYAWADTALQLSRQLGNRQLEGAALLQMGLCTRRGFTTLARRNFSYYQAAASVTADTNTLYLSEVYTAVDHFELYEAEAAMPHLRQALALMPNVATLRGRYIGYVALAYALQQADAPESALPLYKQALALTVSADLPYSRQNALTYISKMFQELRQYDSALYYANQAAEVLHVDSFYSNIWGLRADILRQAGQYKAAADAYPKALAWETADALYRNQNQLAQYEAVLKTQEKELQVAQEKRRSTRLQWIIALAGLLLGLLSLAYAVQRRTQRKLAAQKAVIERQSTELKASLTQKEILLREIITALIIILQL